MGNEENWRTPTDAGDYFGSQAKKLNVADRRPVIRKAADLVGPGIASQAIPVVDMNDLLATYNGYYSTEALVTSNTPNPSMDFVGHTVMDASLGGVQHLTSMYDGTEYSRRFIRNPSDPESISWGAWQVVSDIIPVGAMMPYGGAVAPYRWLLCNGASYSASLYPALFAVIGTTFGGSGGSFNVPDLRDRAVYGVGSDWALGTTDGIAYGSRDMDLWHQHAVAVGESASHSHSASTGSAGSHSHSISEGGSHNHGGATGTPSGGVTRASGASDTAGASHSHSIDAGGLHSHGGLTGTETSHSHTATTAADGVHAHSGITFDFGPIGATLRGVGLNIIIRHGTA